MFFCRQALFSGGARSACVNRGSSQTVLTKINLLLVISALPVTTALAQTNSPVRWNANQDHQNMLAQLGIKSLRPGAEGMSRQAANYQNTDEAKANPWPNLPEMLTLKNGEKVTTEETWWQKRRPEIVEDFDREVYGRVPWNVPPVTWKVTSNLCTNNGDLPIIVKQLVGHLDNSACPQIDVEIQLTLTTPADAKGPVPVMLDFGFGNFPGFGGRGRFGDTNYLSGTNHPAYTNTFRTFAGFDGPSWQPLCLSKGWGYAVIVPTSFQADNGAGLTQGIIGLCNHGQPRKPEDWGALRAWAWGASRALDYFETDSAVDAKHVGIEGLSRYGKAAIVTMAYDQRFAIALVGSSGEGGAKLHRRNWGELVENLTGSGEYHWMAGNFLKYGGPLTPGDLPVDAHELIALCAPRPTFISYGASQGSPGAEGTWVDQHGSFMAAVAAGPVFRLLGKKDLGTPGNYLTDPMPAVNESLIDGDLAWRQHDGGHTDAPNWPFFLKFASKYFVVPSVTKGAAFTEHYRNMFADLGYAPGKVSAKIQAAFQQLFHGDPANEAVYFPAGTNSNGTLAYIHDLANGDVRSEGMSYGMMIAVQLDKKPEFDAIWNWAKNFMYHASPAHPAFGYFSWSMKTNGMANDEMPAPDGEQYFATALYFAAARWGNGEGIYNYRAEANSLLDHMKNRVLITGATVKGPMSAGALFEPINKMIRFTPDMANWNHTDPSYQMPAFYEVWALRGPKADRAFWREAANASREFFQQSAHPATGLAPDYANFNGTPWAAPWNPHSADFQYDSWRTAMNWSVDWAWWSRDAREQVLSDRLQGFFEAKGIASYGSRFTVDGNQFGNDHTAGLVAMNAVASLAANDPRSQKFVEALWNTPVPTGQWRYYDGMLYLLAMLHCSGEFKVWNPQ
jgi:endo-1,4-beta-D-glucanase Y